MSSSAVLDREKAPPAGRNLTALVLLGAVLAAGATVVGLNMAREKARWLTLVDRCPQLDLTVGEQLGVDPDADGLLRQANERRVCSWSGPAGLLRATITRYDGSLLTNPDDAAIHGVADTRLIGFHPAGEQTPTSVYGDWRPEKNATALVTATSNVVVMVEHQGTGTAATLRAPLTSVSAALIRQLG